MFFPWDYRNYNPLEEQVKAIVPDTYVIGDAIRARRALDATKEAYEVASQIYTRPNTGEENEDDRHERMAKRNNRELLALIGSPVGHSGSPDMYNFCFRYHNLDYCYMAFDIKEDQVPAALDAMRLFNMRGCNVTMPCKTSSSADWMSCHRQQESSVQ